MPELFADGRGGALRATWHDDAGLVVLSVWRGAACVGTVRLTPDEAERLSVFLQASAPRASC